MDSTLVAVTLISMGMAVTLSVIVWRMLREERRRTAARVIALKQLAGEPRPSTGTGRTTAVPSATLFAARSDAPSPWGGRLVVMACLALAGAAIVFYALISQQQSATAGRQVSATPAPLELLSLHDTRDGASLMITGLVQNPSNGSPLSHIAVTAFAFDEKGDFLASGRAMLEVTSLTPGDQSPFSVSVPVSGDVARYRIGFRTDDGRVIAHVDERGAANGARGTSE